MDLNSLTGLLNNFLNSGIGHAIVQGFTGIFNFFFPANAPAAHEVPLPTPKAPGK